MATELERAEPPLVVITGPTASGKTSLVIALAGRFGGEIICADSRTVYRDMDIGTAKPTAAERTRVPHWGLDLVVPGDRFTAADFKHYAESKIEEIRARGHVPFLVGGTGLYIDGVVFDYRFGADVDEGLRQLLDSMSVDELQNYCNKNNIELPENSQNRRYLVRSIERRGSNHKRNTEPLPNSIIVGITTNRELLRTRIEHRSEQLFDDGVVEEAIMLGKKYGWNNEAMTGNVYPLVRQYLEGGLSMHEVQQKFVTLDWRLAKRQLTWLRRNKYIQWKTLEEAEHYLSDILARMATS
ncbi:tRNA (adenosine(37)-N6)-dimethylallyltransferase MiaA [Candidatus Mycosynbacter amalyticus]|uniref:tRNA dimethylallyltransferase n=1 Tax=Candidatus Mycosynbacter amalyticus TaxID=2665156 RepID=A0A857MME5_9BACT|nr:tRNA (adenosine(37)-N6)-dimethylallyltransferase MiaA [Candidatus Mycosynbacter amalyticus]QHN42449.1 tRNA (adenosine(37)-N6)-dimethylallyltransferase MiaA [Candidatus Mycosynbacter amalyticus]